MNDSEFIGLLQRRLKLIQDVLEIKAKEYATLDRLSNFKRQAQIKNTNPAEALLGNLTKHIVSVINLIESYGKGATITESQIDEKIGDSINYLILLEAIFRERLKEKERETSSK